MAPRAAARDDSPAPRALPRVRLSRARVAALIRILAIGGLEPTGKVGLLADAWAIRALGAEPMFVATAVTAQSADVRLEAVSVELVRAQLDAALARKPAAVKVGLVPHARMLDPIVARLQRVRVPIVIDPIVVSAAGARLSSLRPIDFRRLAFGRAVLTPNRDELAWLGTNALVFAARVVKGSDTATDEVVVGRDTTVLHGSRLPRNTSHHRGTGCRFGSGLAVGLARGEDVVSAARGARRLVRKFLRSPILG